MKRESVELTRSFRKRCLTPEGITTRKSVVGRALGGLPRVLNARRHHDEEEPPETSTERPPPSTCLTPEGITTRKRVG